MVDDTSLTPLPKCCLSVVIPCFNEVERIQQCIDRVLEQPVVGEVIVVDDGSTDGTSAVLNEITDDRVVVRRHPENRCKGAAIRTGFELVSAPFVVIQDSDLEQNPSDYDQLIRPLVDGRADVVYGSRFPDRRRLQGQYRSHFLANRFLTILSNTMTGLQLTDMETGYKVFTKEVNNSLTFKSNRFGFEPEFTAKVAKNQFRLFEVPISYNGRTYSEGKKITWKDGLAAIWFIFKFRFLD